MFKFRLNSKRLSIWILFLVQLLLLTAYFYLQINENAKQQQNKYQQISFPPFTHNSNNAATAKSPKSYHTINSKIFLKTLSTRNNFIDFNSSLCYINGTDLVAMKRTKQPNWNCECLRGWHGRDCGQPEVIWRAALIANNNKLANVKGPRQFQRRLIYFIKTNKHSSEILNEIQINEMGDVVDLFVLIHSDTPNPNLLRNIANYRNKLLYLKPINQLWRSIKRTIRNLKDDDIILIGNENEIPNKFALNFLKYYDRWPEPVRLRLRWSVYGFFWTHPNQTVIGQFVSSIQYLRQTYNDGELDLILSNNYNDQTGNHGLILGDLNHFGGWFCEFCNNPAQLVEHLTATRKNIIKLDEIGRGTIDANYIEELIENGIYLNGKTELIRAHRYNEKYFAPFYVTENNWKYDFLMINLYSKLDYYDG